MSQNFRICDSLVDQGQTLRFTFNGRSLEGHPGDTLAAALLANGRRLVARSFKYHRPRGVFSAGSEEPNALVQLRKGPYREPNTKATTVELFEGLAATSQNHRLSLEHDLMSVSDLFSAFLTAGFYYKTFMWPKSFWEKLYEPIIRASAGLGRLSLEPDPDVYDKGFRHCDVLVIGAGPAGLSAALAAGRAGARVALADEDFLMGGRLNSESFEVAGAAGSEWAKKAVLELASLPNVVLMPRTTVYGSFDHGIFGALERTTDHLHETAGKPRQILWRMYAKRSVLCAGATERPIAFGKQRQARRDACGRRQVVHKPVRRRGGNEGRGLHEQRRRMAHGCGPVAARCRDNGCNRQPGRTGASAYPRRKRRHGRPRRRHRWPQSIAFNHAFGRPSRSR